MPKPITVYYIQTNMLDTGEGQVSAKFTPVGGVEKIVNKTYAELSAGDKVIYDNFIAMIQAQ